MIQSGGFFAWLKIGKILLLGLELLIIISFYYYDWRTFFLTVYTMNGLKFPFLSLGQINGSMLTQKLSHGLSLPSDPSCNQAITHLKFTFRLPPKKLCLCLSCSQILVPGYIPFTYFGRCLPLISITCCFNSKILSFLFSSLFVSLFQILSSRKCKFYDTCVHL